MGCRRLEFLVYDWNPVQRFYEKQNAINVTKRDGYQVFRVDGIEPLSKQWINARINKMRFEFHLHCPLNNNLFRSSAVCAW